MKSNELSDRLFEFAKNVILLLRKLPNSLDLKIIKYQLVKAAGSSGANYEEAQSGSSKADFTYKVEISLREMRESNYWLRLMKETNDGFNNCINTQLENLIDEAGQLQRILGAIVVKMKNREK